MRVMSGFVDPQKGEFCGQVNTFAFAGTEFHPQTQRGQLGKPNSTGGGPRSTKAFHVGGDRIPFIGGLVTMYFRDLEMNFSLFALFDQSKK